MTDLSLLSEAQMRRIGPFFLLSHGIVKRPFNCGYLSSLHIDPNRGHGPFRGHAS